MIAKSASSANAISPVNFYGSPSHPPPKRFVRCNRGAKSDDVTIWPKVKVLFKKNTFCCISHANTLTANATNFTFQFSRCIILYFYLLKLRIFFYLNIFQQTRTLSPTIWFRSACSQRWQLDGHSCGGLAVLCRRISGDLGTAGR